MRPRILRSIDEVDPAAWDALTGDAVLCHGWFRALEASGAVACQPRHIVLEEGDRLLAALPCFVQRGDPYATLVERLAGPAARGLSKRALVAYSPLVQRSDLLRAPEVPMRAVVRTCRAMMDRICADESIALSGWPFVRSDDAELVGALREAGYQAGFLAPAAGWSRPPHASFDGYLESFKRVSRKRYKDLRHELNRFARSGIELREQPLAEIDDALLAEMQSSHYARHNAGAQSPFDQRFFAALKRELGDRALVHTAVLEGEILSYSIVLTGCGRWHMFLSGDRDAESAHRDKLHFNLNFYYPIRRAIECGADWLDYGLSTYEAKLQRGCVLEGVTFFVRAHTPLLRALLPGWVWAVDRWYRHKHRGLPRDAWHSDSRVVARPGAWARTRQDAPA